MKNTLIFATVFITLAILLLLTAIALSFKTLYVGNTDIRILQGFLLFGASIYAYIGRQLVIKYRSYE